MFRLFADRRLRPQYLPEEALLQDLAQFIASGLTRGAIYALAGAGFAIIYGASNVINFAQGEFVMLGGMVTAFLTVTTGLLPLYLAIPAAILLTAVVGIALYRFAVAKIEPSRIATIIIITIGSSILIRGVVEVALGKREFVYPAFTPAEPVTLFGAAIDVQTLWVLGALVVVAVGLKVFFDHTLYGKAMRAAAQNPVAAQLVGIDVHGVLVASFALSAALGALAGAFVTPITLTRFDVGVMLGLKGFAATMLGGLGSPFGALAGGLLLGLAEALAGGYISSGYQDAVAFLLILGLIFFRPAGLLGRMKLERV
jgi:branched-chain amino acid transport system permease protein